MEKSTFEQMGVTYRQEGDYFLPNLTVPERVPAGTSSVSKNSARNSRTPISELLLAAAAWSRPPIAMRMTGVW